MMDFHHKMQLIISSLNLQTKSEKDTIVFLPGLNGLRAIAAISVVIAHVTNQNISDFGFPNTFNFGLADYGVTLFFVISGFLITFLLLKEQMVSGNILVPKFYLRRILRIWPLYYFYILIIIAFLYLTNKTEDFKSEQLWFYVFFMANIPIIAHNVIFLIAHYWSIGVEEQFYLFWPWFLKIKKSKLFKIIVIIIFLLIIAKFILYLTVGQASLSYRFLFYSRFQCMMIGALGGILFIAKNKLFLNLFSAKLVQFLSWIIFFLIGFNLIDFPLIVSHEVISVASLSIIIGQFFTDRRLVNLDTKFFDMTGKISYGVYIYHPLVIVMLSKIIKPIEMQITVRYIIAYSTSVIISLCIAWISFKYFENPFLKLKSKIAVIKSKSSKY